MKEITQDDLILAVRRLSSSPDWKLVMDYLTQRWGFIDRTTLGPSPQHTALNEGRRTVVTFMHRLHEALTISEQKEMKDVL